LAFDRKNKDVHKKTARSLLQAATRGFDDRQSDG